MNIYNIPAFGISIQTDGKGAGQVITSALKKEFAGKGKGLVVDTLESFILAQACAGIDISTKEYSDALQTTVDAINFNIFS